MAKILVHDGQAVYRTGLANLIRAEIADAEVIESCYLSKALQLIREHLFDLALFASEPCRLEKFDYLKTTLETSPGTRFAILATSDARSEILACLAAGFHGFISKHWPDIQILTAITEILSGRIYVPQSIAEIGDSHTLPARSNGTVVPSSIEATMLTKRQREVLALLTHGSSNKEIAGALGIAEATIKIHVAALIRSLGVRNRTEAAFKARTLADFGDRGE